MINDLSSFFIFFGGFMSWTIALGLIIEKDKKTFNYLFAATMFCLGALQILDGMFVSGKFAEYSYLIFWHLPFIAWLGPLFLLTFKSANDDAFRLRPVDYLHFICGIVAIPFMVPLFTMDVATKMSFIMEAPYFTGSTPLLKLYSWLLMAVIVNLAGYLIYFVRECFFMLDYRLIRKKSISPYLMIVMLILFPLEIIFFGSVIAMTVFGGLHSLYFSVVQALTAGSFLVTLFIFIMDKKEINFFKLLNMQIEEKRHEDSRTKNLDVALIVSDIRSLMEEEKRFCDEDLSVNGLAGELEIEPYQLSKIINENFGRNFNCFINEYRIEEARKMLLAERSRTIISVAYAVGFNSTTVFYEWFKRITGVSPKQYRDRNKQPDDAPAEEVIGN